MSSCGPSRLGVDCGSGRIGSLTSSGFRVSECPITEGASGAPVFVDAVAWLDCEVRKQVDCGTHTLFIGELIDAAVVDDDARPASTTIWPRSVRAVNLC